ncbi:family 16 glycoside hydrolase [Verrucomicrobiota bacterium sgz303538]
MKRLSLSITALLLFVVGVQAQQNAAPNVLGMLTKTLGKTEDPSTQLNLLRGMNAALKGKRDIPAPEGWAEIYEKLKTSSSEEVRQQAQALAATFGGGNALAELRKTLADSSAAPEARRAALESVISAKDAAAVPALLNLAKEPGPLRAAAIRALATFDDAQIPTVILTAYSGLSSDEKRDALGTLLARLPWAKLLVAAIDQKNVSRSDLSAPLARQLQDFKDPEINSWLAKNWGAVRASSADKQKEIAHYKTFLTPANFESADPQRGRALFAQTCLACHTMFGTGGKIGPELTGAYNDVDYLLQNILDPNAIIGKDYQQTIVRTKDGQMLSGVVSAEDAASITLKTLAGPLAVQRGDISEVTVSDVSMMPEGLLSVMADDEIRDLFAYLRQHGQIPRLVTPNNINDFFNGTDLAGWHLSSQAWRVENGEIVGSGSAIHPEFLVSDMAAGDFRFTAQIKVSGTNPVAEIALRGQEHDGTFEGTALSLGGTAPVSLWKYQAKAKPASVSGKSGVKPDEWTQLEVVAQGGKLHVSLSGQEAFVLDNAFGAPRSVLAFHLLGEDAQLRIRQPKLELLNK